VRSGSSLEAGACLLGAEGAKARDAINMFRGCISLRLDLMYMAAHCSRPDLGCCHGIEAKGCK
jgi:hypothetical protein